MGGTLNLLRAFPRCVAIVRVLLGYSQLILKDSDEGSLKVGTGVGEARPSIVGEQALFGCGIGR
jgi:hypothetical protein